MNNQINIFNIKFFDEELEKEFYKVFDVFDLHALFNEEKRAGEISVSDSEARALVNEGGAYRQNFKDMHDYLKLAEDNQKYEEAVFNIIYKANSLQKMNNQIKKTMDFIDHDIKPEHLFNTWNIVHYSKKLN